MLKKITFLLALTAMFSCDAQLGNVLGTVLGENSGLTNGDISSGLKEALEIGIGKGADQLSAQDGYYKSIYKILLPAEAQKVTNRLKNVPGFGQLEENILEKINRGAEDAATRAKPIFVNAIRSMTIGDALGILKGEKNAATSYLKRVTYDQLYQEFNPVIVSSLDKFNARQIWGDAVNTYNSLPLVREKADPDLDDYVTRQALDGLFSKIAEEELNIRTNLAARTTDLLRRVFAEQDK